MHGSAIKVQPCEPMSRGSILEPIIPIDLALFQLRFPGTVHLDFNRLR